MSYQQTVRNAWRNNHLMSVLFELTYACNWDCEFCYNDRSLSGEALSLRQYYQILEDLYQMGVLRVTLSGGEPLAHRDFFEIGSRANELGFVIRIKTNGHAVHKHNALQIKNRINPYYIEVSLHGADAATHDRQTRVPGSFDRLLTNIQHMLDAGLRVQVNSTLTKYNQDQVAEMYDICDRLGLKLQIDPEVKPRDNGDESPLALEPSAEGLDNLHALRRRRWQAQNPEQSEPLPVHEIRESSFEGIEKHCGAGSSGICIDPVGNVLPCVQWRVSLGNLHQTRITAIWHQNPALDEIRSTTVAAKKMVDGMGTVGAELNFCPGAAHTHTGNALQLYPAAQQRLQVAEKGKIRLRVI